MCQARKRGHLESPAAWRISILEPPAIHRSSSEKLIPFALHLLDALGRCGIVLCVRRRRRRDRRKHLAWHSRLLRASRATRLDRHTQSQGQRRHLQVFRREPATPARQAFEASLAYGKYGRRANGVGVPIHSAAQDSKGKRYAPRLRTTPFISTTAYECCLAGGESCHGKKLPPHFPDWDQPNSDEQETISSGSLRSLHGCFLLR